MKDLTKKFVLFVVIICLTGCSGGKLFKGDPDATDVLFIIAVIGMIIGVVIFLDDTNKRKDEAGAVAIIGLITALILLA